MEMKKRLRKKLLNLGRIRPAGVKLMFRRKTNGKWREITQVVEEGISLNEMHS